MTINEIQKLRQISPHSQEELVPQGSLLNQTRLNRFILIALLLHALVIILQSFVISKSIDSLPPPPIKVKYVDIQKPEYLEKIGAFIKTPKPKKTDQQKPKPSGLLASPDISAHANKNQFKQKKYRQKKKTAPKIHGKTNISHKAKAQTKLKKLSARSKKRTSTENIFFPLSDKGPVVPKATKQNSTLVPLEKLNFREVLSMLDGFDVGKYATQDTQTSTKNGSDVDEPISLDTTEVKYFSYFNRIKHQIQRVWTYPSQAAQSGMDGQLTLKFQISRDGNLIGVSLVQHSGFEILDMAAIKAVKEAAPYYPFPVTIPKKKISILATFIYNPNSMQSNAQ